MARGISNPYIEELKKPSIPLYVCERIEELKQVLDKIKQL